MLKYFYLSIIILVIFSLVQFERIFTIRRRKDITTKFIPITFTLVVGVVLLLGLPLMKGTSNYDEEKLDVDGVIAITKDNYGIVNHFNENREIYSGKIISFVGFVEKGDVNNNSEIIVSREAVDCCQSDKHKIQLRTKGMDNSIESGQWVTIVGKISFDDSYYVDIQQYKLRNEPKDIYFH